MACATQQILPVRYGTCYFSATCFRKCGHKGRLPGERAGEGQWNWGGEKMRGKRGEEEGTVGRRESRRDHDGLVDIQSASPFLT